MSSHCALRITLSVILVGITVDAVPVVQEKSAQLPLSESHVTHLSSQTPWVSVPAARGIVATQLAVVINAADAQSVTVGTAYAAARHVPAANVVTLNFSTGSILSHDEFAKVCTAYTHAPHVPCTPCASRWSHARPCHVSLVLVCMPHRLLRVVLTCGLVWGTTSAAVVSN